MHVLIMYLLGEVEFGVETFVCVFLNMSSIRMLIFIIFKKLLNMIFLRFHMWRYIPPMGENLRPKHFLYFCRAQTAGHLLLMAAISM
jgi:hypothetical protein